MAVSQNAGLGIRESLVSINKSETHKGFKEMIDEMVIALTEGASLAEALQEYDYFFGSDEIERIFTHINNEWRLASSKGNLEKIPYLEPDKIYNLWEY